MWKIFVCLFAIVSIASGAKKIVAEKANEQYLVLNAADSTQDVGFESVISVPPPKVKADVLLWDPEKMPRPDPNAKPSHGPDVYFRPKYLVVPESENGPYHTTQRNMVVPGTDMVSIDKDPDLRPMSIPDAIQKLESFDFSGMPNSPGSELTADCADEGSVLRIGEPPVFSKSPLLPTREPKGAIPEVNSYKDFLAGDIATPFTPSKELEQIVVVTTPEDHLNPADKVEESKVQMRYKFLGNIRFHCGQEISKDFATRYGRPFRSGISLGAQVPIGNVAITEVHVPNVVSFEVGAPTLVDVATEVNQLKEYVRYGDFAVAIKAQGFPQCEVVDIQLGDGIEDVGLMPEATLKQQLGPPGGHEDEPVSSLEELRERVRTREVMTYGEYTKPGKYNMTNLSPHLFTEGDQSRVNETGRFYVIGRIKFLMADHENVFSALYAPLVARALADATGLEPSNIIVSVDGEQKWPFHSLIQSESSANKRIENADRDSYVLVDFEIEVAGSVESARRVQSAIVSSMSDLKSGFRYFLANTRAFPPNVDFTLLFIEIHGSDGITIDDCQDDPEEDDEDPDVKSLESEIGRAASAHKKDPVVVGTHENVTVVNGGIAPESMNNPVDCNTTATEEEPAKIYDPSVEPKVEPAVYNETWTVMKDAPRMKSYMNLPGRVEFYPKTDPITAVQITPSETIVTENNQEVQLKPLHSLRPRRFVSEDSDDESPLNSLHDKSIGTTQLDQIEWQSSAITPLATSSMPHTLAEVEAVEVATLKIESQSKNNEMPEAPEDDNVPAGGFPVADNDEGAL